MSFLYVERLRINVEIRRKKRLIHACRVVKRYGKPLKLVTETQEFILWAHEHPILSSRTIDDILCECKRSSPEIKHLSQHNLHHKK